MRVLPHNLISFTSIPLYNVKLRQKQKGGTYKEIPATFSKLDINDKNDVLRAKDICHKWPDSRFGAIAAKDFLKSDETEEYKDFRFYIIEEKGKKKKKEIYSIAEFDSQHDLIELLQSNPSNKEEGIKGAGEVMLYGIAKENKPNNPNYIFYLEPTPSSSGFYYNLGLDTSLMYYILPKSDKDEFLDRVEKKYHFSAEA